MAMFQAHFGCNDILKFGRSPLKWKQRPDITIAVDWDANSQLKQAQEYNRLTDHLITRSVPAKEKWLLIHIYKP